MIAPSERQAVVFKSHERVQSIVQAVGGVLACSGMRKQRVRAAFQLYLLLQIGRFYPCRSAERAAALADDKGSAYLVRPFTISTFERSAPACLHGRCGRESRHAVIGSVGYAQQIGFSRDRRPSAPVRGVFRMQP